MHSQMADHDKLSGSGDLCGSALDSRSEIYRFSLLKCSENPGLFFENPEIHFLDPKMLPRGVSKNRA